MAYGKDKNQRLQDDLRAFVRKQTYENKIKNPKYNEIFGALNLGKSKEPPKTEAEKRFAEAQSKLQIFMGFTIVSMVLTACLARIFNGLNLVIITLDFNASLFLVFLIAVIVGSFFGAEHKSAFIDLQKEKGLSEKEARRAYRDQFCSGG